MKALDLCPQCGAAVDVKRRENDTLQYICRNPQCSQFGQILTEQEDQNPNG